MANTIHVTSLYFLKSGSSMKRERSSEVTEREKRVDPPRAAKCWIAKSDPFS